MPISARLESELEELLENYCAATGARKTDVIRESLIAYLKRSAQPPTLYDLGKDLFGADKTKSKNNVAANYKTLLKVKLGKKHSR